MLKIFVPGERRPSPTTASTDVRAAAERGLELPARLRARLDAALAAELRSPIPQRFEQPPHRRPERRKVGLPWEIRAMLADRAG